MQIPGEYQCLQGLPRCYCYPDFSDTTLAINSADQTDQAPPGSQTASGNASVCSDSHPRVQSPSPNANDSRHRSPLVNQTPINPVDLRVRLQSPPTTRHRQISLNITESAASATDRATPTTHIRRHFTPDRTTASTRPFTPDQANPSTPTHRHRSEDRATSGSPVTPPFHRHFTSDQATPLTPVTHGPIQGEVATPESPVARRILNRASGVTTPPRNCGDDVFLSPSVAAATGQSGSSPAVNHATEPTSPRSPTFSTASLDELVIPAHVRTGATYYQPTKNPWPQVLDAHAVPQETKDHFPASASDEDGRHLKKWYVVGRGNDFGIFFDTW